MINKHAIWMMALGGMGLGIGSPAGAEQWYRGNGHTHCLWSHDADGFPEMVADWYKSQGYHFLIFTDHNYVHVHEKWMSLDAIRERTVNPPDDLLAGVTARFGEGWVVTRQREGLTEVRLKTHDEVQAALGEPGRFLVVRGEEITSALGEKTVHLNGFNLGESIPPREGDTIADTIRNNLLPVIEQERAAGVPMLAQLNHPNYRWSTTADDMVAVSELEFFEVYNAFGPATNHHGDAERPGVEALWDIVNTRRLRDHGLPPLYGTATDDSHQYYGGPLSPGKGWIVVRAPALEPDLLVHAMRRGDFYASSGVTLRDIRFDPATRTLTVEIDAEPGETYTTTFQGTRTNSDDIGQVFATHTGDTAVYQLTGDELYVRATVSSDHPPQRPSLESQVKQAWTQPVGWSRHMRDDGGSTLRDFAEQEAAQ